MNTLKGYQLLLSTIKDVLIKVLWAFFLLALPLTSFPFFPAEFGGTASVRPLSLYPLFGLLLLVTLPRLFRDPLPKLFLPLFAFGLLSLASAGFAATNTMVSLRDVSPFLRSMRGLFALGIGVAFYITVSLYAQSWDALRTSLRWIYLGFSVALLWGTIQISYILKIAPALYNMLSQIQRLISSRKLMLKRISGLTYEPKWFAEQLCFLLIPYLLASVLSGYSVFRWKFHGFSVELFLLIWASIVLLFTYSRSGLFALFVLLAVGAWLNRNSIRVKIRQWEVKRNLTHFWVMIGVTVCMVSLFVFWVGSQNNYFSRLWNYWLVEENGSGDYLEYIAFRQRMVYAETAFRMYEAFPVLGVGLGNYAFHFADMLPNQSWHRQPDILRQISHAEGREKLITPKNLFMKVIAETGLLGFGVFCTFLLMLLSYVLYLINGKDDGQQMIFGTAGVLGMIAFIVFAFSYDSFATPNMWVVFGLITASTRLVLERKHE